MDRLKTAMVPLDKNVSFTLFCSRSRHKASFFPSPQVVPRMFQWSTYPITAILERIWDRALPDLQAGRSIDPHLIEMVSLFERALNFAHTGAARVLQRSLMDHTFLSLGVIFDGFPSLSNDFVPHYALNRGSLKLCADHWPLERESGRPLTSSQRVQTLTYGTHHYEVCCCCYPFSLPAYLYSSSTFSTTCIIIHPF